MLCSHREHSIDRGWLINLQFPAPSAICFFAPSPLFLYVASHARIFHCQVFHFHCYCSHCEHSLPAWPPLIPAWPPLIPAWPPPGPWLGFRQPRPLTFSPSQNTAFPVSKPLFVRDDPPAQNLFCRREKRKSLTVLDSRGMLWTDDTDSTASPAADGHEEERDGKRNF